MTEIREMFEIKPPKLNWVEPHPRKKWSEQAPDVDTVHDLDLAEHWVILQKITSKQWSGTPYREDMLGVASEAFIHDVNSFDGWCRRKGLKPNRQLFTHYAKKGARFATLKYWNETIKREARALLFEDFADDEDTPAETVFTQLRVRDPDRTLLHAIASKIPTVLNRNQRFALALLVWEELSVKAAGELMGVTSANVSKVSIRAANKILLVARNETTTQITPVEATLKTKAPLSIDLIRYIDDRYRTSPDEWLTFVETDYMVDVSYVEEILHRAHGKGPQRGRISGTSGAPLTITAEQDEEIIQRRAAGESRQRIADDMGITRDIVLQAERRELKKRQQG